MREQIKQYFSALDEAMRLDRNLSNWTPGAVGSNAERTDAWAKVNRARAAVEVKLDLESAQQDAEKADAQPIAWFAFADNNGPVPLELYGWDEMACKHAVLSYARAGNWKGSVEGYLLRNGWTLRPVYLATAKPDPAIVGDAVSKQLQGMADDAYCRYIRQLRDDECLGVGHKLENNKFGVAELAAHNKAYEFLGRHRAFSEAAELIKRAQP